MPFQMSPGVITTEIDLTTVIPAVSTTNGGFVGDFNWGPANTVITIDSEDRLASVFGQPDNNTAVSFLTAASFLSYGNNLKVVRTSNSGSRNAYNLGTANAPSKIENQDQWFAVHRATPTTTGGYGTNTLGIIAKYPGEWGNSLSIAFCPAANAGSNGFESWAYKSYFDGAPGTSPYAQSRGCANDEIHVVVVDRLGYFSQGAQNYNFANGNVATTQTVLEVFPYMSVAVDAKNADGTSIFYPDVLASSKYINWIAHPANTTNWGTSASNGTSFSAVVGWNSGNTANAANLSGGSFALGDNSDEIRAWDKFKNSDEVDVSLLVTADASPPVVQHVIDNVVEFRKDCVAFVSPASANVVNKPATEVTQISNYKNAIGRSSSYAVMDSGWKYMYDKYSGQYRYIPLNGDIAGLCVRTDTTRDPWFSPAGFNRGQIKNIVKLAWNPSKTYRDELYKIGVNPVATFTGEGTILFGDKTMLTRPSAFDRINVRRLFIVLEKAIATAAKYSLFEFNDEFTRSQFVSLVDPFLRDVQGRRGIYDYRVICDESNNTPEVIDRNEFVGDIYIKPARSINFIQLNFVAVRTGVAFDEIVGRF